MCILFKENVILKRKVHFQKQHIDNFLVFDIYVFLTFFFTFINTTASEQTNNISNPGVLSFGSDLKGVEPNKSTCMLDFGAFHLMKFDLHGALRNFYECNPRKFKFLDETRLLNIALYFLRFVPFEIKMFIGLLIAFSHLYKNNTKQTNNNSVRCILYETRARIYNKRLMIAQDCVNFRERIA